VQNPNAFLSPTQGKVPTTPAAIPKIRSVLAFHLLPEAKVYPTQPSNSQQAEQEPLPCPKLKTVSPPKK
jgi:hypothetical protein